jgi:hypothetical protein
MLSKVPPRKKPFDCLATTDHANSKSSHARSPAVIHRGLVAYGQILARETGQGAVEPAKLIAPMLERFMSTDRVFAKLRRPPLNP